MCKSFTDNNIIVCVYACVRNVWETSSAVSVAIGIDDSVVFDYVDWYISIVITTLALLDKSATGILSYVFLQQAQTELNEQRSMQTCKHFDNKRK